MDFGPREPTAGRFVVRVFEASGDASRLQRRDQDPPIIVQQLPEHHTLPKDRRSAKAYGFFDPLAPSLTRSVQFYWLAIGWL